MTGRHPKPFTKADPPSQTVDPRFGGHRYRCTSIDGRVPRERRCSSDRFGTCARLDRPCSLGTMGIRPRLLGGDQSSIVRASAISPSSTAGMGGTLCATPERWRMRPEARLGPSVPSSNFGLNRDGSPMTHRWTEVDSNPRSPGHGGAPSASRGQARLA
jgi:hypothetical protein